MLQKSEESLRNPQCVFQTLPLRSTRSISCVVTALPECSLPLPLSPSRWPAEERKSCYITPALFKRGLSQKLHHFHMSRKRSSSQDRFALRMKRSGCHSDKALPVSCDVFKCDRFCRSRCENMTAQWISGNSVLGGVTTNSVYSICIQQTFCFVSFCYFYHNDQLTLSYKFETWKTYVPYTPYYLINWLNH